MFTRGQEYQKSNARFGAIKLRSSVLHCPALPSCANLAGPVRQFSHATAVRAGPH